MALLKRNAASGDDSSRVVTATVRFARNPDDLAAIRSGDIVLVDVPGLSTATAQALIARRVAAVLNVSGGSGSQFPRFGARLLHDADIPLVENLGDSVWSSLRSGETVRLEDNALYRADALVATGQRQTAELVEQTIDEASIALANRLDSVTANAAERLRRERTMLLEGEGVPKLSVKVKGRPAVVVSDAHDVRSDLRGIRRYIRDNDPVLLAVGSGADVLLAMGLTPHVLVGRSDELTTTGIEKATDVVVVSADGHLDGADRFEGRKQSAQVFASSGASEDLAMMLADAQGASVIVTAGAAPSLEALLDRDTADVSSSFITRLAVGRRVVDAKAVHQFAVQRIGWVVPLLLVLAGVVAVAVAVAVTPRGATWYADPSGTLGDFWTWIKGLFS